MRYHEVPADSKHKTMVRYVSKYLFRVLCQQFTYTSTIYVQSFCDILRLSVLIKLIFWAASAMTDIVSVSVIVEPLSPSLDFYDTKVIYNYVISSGIRLVATIVTIVKSISSESKYYACVLIMLYALAISVSMCDLRSFRA